MTNTLQNVNDTYIRERITELRMQKSVSEHKMSFDIGRSKGYIQNIISGRALPSLAEFLAICNYLGVTPKDFFDTEVKYPVLINQAIATIRTLGEKDVRFVLDFLDRMKR